MGAVVGGDFRVERELSRGGMGAVYVATQLSTGKQRALKVMHPELVPDDKSRRRFADEAKIGARIPSDHIVEVIAAGVDEDLPWLAMELLDGRTLAEIVEPDGGLPWPDVAELFSQLGHALEAAHAKGVVHRDLKPENIFVAGALRHGVDLTVKILDFGIATTVERSRDAKTVTSAIGSPFFIAPEQASPGQKLNATADVWSLGLIAYYSLTGCHYWRAARQEGGLNALLAEILVHPIEPASLRAREVGVSGSLPSGFDAWFARCVARDPTRRFPSAGPAVAALVAALTHEAAGETGQATAVEGGEASGPPTAEEHGPRREQAAPRTGTGPEPADRSVAPTQEMDGSISASRSVSPTQVMPTRDAPGAAPAAPTRALAAAAPTSALSPKPSRDFGQGASSTNAAGARRRPSVALIGSIAALSLVVAGGLAVIAWGGDSGGSANGAPRDAARTPRGRAAAGVERPGESHVVHEPADDSLRPLSAEHPCVGTWTGTHPTDTPEYGASAITLVVREPDDRDVCGTVHPRRDAADPGDDDPLESDLEREELFQCAVDGDEVRFALMHGSRSRGRYTLACSTDRAVLTWVRCCSSTLRSVERQ